jgi:hypothetical protein
MSLDILLGPRQETENGMITFMYMPLLGLSLVSFLDISIWRLAQLESD